MAASENAKYLLLICVQRSLHNAAAQDNPGHKKYLSQHRELLAGQFAIARHPIAERRRPTPLPSDT
jgi:hypothetical protein